MKILITGCAGFIGMHTSLKFLNLGFVVIGIDNLNDYYDVNLKKARVNKLKNKHNFIFYQTDIKIKRNINSIFKKEKFDFVIHLAAQAGVRYSLKNPRKYFDTNVIGFFNILEASKLNKVKDILYASSSSVYGLNNKAPFSETDITNNPASFYGATKSSNELFAFSYANIYKMNIIGLRFFTVYGPWGRPDMALTKFTNSILNETKIKLYNSGKMYRDFTFIDDVVTAIEKLFYKSINLSPGIIMNNIFNIGNGKPILLSDFVRTLESIIGKKAKIIKSDLQKGDVLATESNSNLLKKTINFEPKTDLSVGIKKYYDWHKEFYS